MKKLTIILAIVMIANVSSAVQMDIFVNGEAWTGGDVAPSDIITVLWINDLEDQYGGFGTFYINVSAGYYEAGSGYLNPALTLSCITPFPLASGFDVLLCGTSYNPLPLVVMASFEFHVPEGLEDPAIIIIDPYQGAWLGTYGAVGPADGLPYVELHVTPEPNVSCPCYGDVVGSTSPAPDGIVNMADLAAFMALLGPVGPPYDYGPPPPYHECLDLAGSASPVPDGWLNMADLGAMMGFLGPFGPPFNSGQCMPAPPTGP
ncbi:MAG: hypothetical protein ACYSWP_03590 [Planctomycetota bacterium]